MRLFELPESVRQHRALRAGRSRLAARIAIGLMARALVVPVFAQSSQPAATRPAIPPSAPAGALPAVSPASAPAGRDWPMFRGTPQLTGVAACELRPRLEVAWKAEFKEPITSTAAIFDGAVYVGCDDAHVYALNLSDGQIRWSYATSDLVRASPAVVEGMVYVGDDAGVIHAVHAANGAARWTFQTGSQIASSVNVSGDRLLVGSYDGNLYCLDRASGKPLWKHPIGDKIHATPALIGSQVVFAGCDARFHILTLADGTEAGSVDLGAVSGCSAAVIGDRAFLGTYGDQVLAIRLSGPKIEWTFEDKQRSFPFLSSPAATEHIVIIGGRDKRLRAFDLGGRPLWEFATRGKIDSSPVIVGDRTYVGCTDGRLYAVSLAAGAEVWHFEAGDAISASPAVAAGRLVIGTEGGRLYCFK